MDHLLFLDDHFKVKEGLSPLVRETVQEFGLKVYFVMLSWWGRGSQARWTGADLLSTLRRFQEEGLCTVLLSYQAGGKNPSGLHQWCRRRNIGILDVDGYQLLSQDGEVIVPFCVPGKAENVMKAVKLIQRRTEKENISSTKVLLIFVDDDYTQYHWMNYFLLFAPWVLSFLKETDDEKINTLLNKITRVCFIKSGSPRIILPYELQAQIVDGFLKPPDYLGVALAIINLALSHKRFGLNGEKEMIDEVIAILRRVKTRNQIFSPRNKRIFLGDGHAQELDRIWREYIYRGGRVTQRLEGILRYLSSNIHCRWLREFTFLLHGDQGAPLRDWLEFSPFSGYALEISLLMQAVCDKAFEDGQILDVVGLPHSHQRSKDLAIWNMMDRILFALDLSRVLYGDLSVRKLVSVYGLRQHYSMLDRYGNVTAHYPRYTGLKIYPPLKSLRLAP